MRIKSICILSILTLWLLGGCEKENTKPVLPEGGVSFEVAAGKDTVEIPISILKDSIFTLDIRATLAGSATADHWVNFRIEPSLLSEYRSLYGEAQLLPASSYLFHKAAIRLPAGSTVSEPAELNIARQTKLLEYTTYVLPIVIESVNGDADAEGAGKTLFYVFKTGRPLVINKTGWTIETYTSHFSNFVPTNLLDEDNVQTYWASDIAARMPQGVTINFNRDITFAALNYFLPPLLNYPAMGGYPTSIQIETSMDGVNWESQGVFAGNVVNNTQTIELGLVTARYLRFTSLAAVAYAATYDTVFISGISLVP